MNESLISEKCTNKNKLNLINFSDKFNIVLIGNENVGKTSILKTLYSVDCFEKIHNLYPTSLSDLKNNTEQINLEFSFNKKLYLFKIWNYSYISNDELVNHFFNKVDAFIIAYSVTDRKSFINIEKWMNEVYDLANTKKIRFYIIGNKNDLEDEREVGVDEIEQFSEKNKIQFFEISSFNSTEIENTFNKIFSELTKIAYSDGYLDTYNSEEVKSSNDCCCSKCLKSCNVF